ncbi:MAG: acyltransferase family protein [Lachnospiraceae bacterium]|nr:acyltransferase family protein [Lachnospiraceae bacterium]
MHDSERNSSIDVIKGIGIILLIIGHCTGFFQNQTESLSDNIVNTIINSFHMPLFFFVVGYCVEEKRL